MSSPHALDKQSFALPPDLQSEVAAALEDWRAGGKVRRLWACDASLWTGGAEAKWLGWLDVVADGRQRAAELARFGAEIARQNITHVLLLGMGGSSLGPEVIAETFGAQRGHPELLVLDSTDPAQIQNFGQRTDPARTLHIVSSKSGTTLEPNILMAHFFARAEAALGAGKAGAHFIAITDPGSALEREAKARGFRHIFFGEPSIGGRYSVLSNFGLVPAASMGLDVARLLDGAATMVRACDAGAPPADNPGVMLGVVLGAAAKAGRDKLTIHASPGLAGFGAWLEQLVAEFDGKARARHRAGRWRAARCHQKPTATTDCSSICACIGTGGGPARRARTRGPSGRAHRSGGCLCHRPGILPLGDRDGGRGRGHRRRSVRPARCRGEQGQDPRTHRRLRDERQAAASSARSWRSAVSRFTRIPVLEPLSPLLCATTLSCRG